jgi:hypothetical protein
VGLKYAVTQYSGVASCGSEQSSMAVSYGHGLEVSVPKSNVELFEQFNNRQLLKKILFFYAYLTFIVLLPELKEIRLISLNSISWFISIEALCLL